MTSLARFLTHRARTGMRDEVRHVWETPMVPTAAENPSHLAYFYSFANDDPALIRVFQLYAVCAASQAFLQKPSYKIYDDSVSHLLAGPPEVCVATPVKISFENK